MTRLANRSGPPHMPSTIPIRHITFNVRYATSKPVSGEKPWSVRCPRLCNQLTFSTSGHPSAFICLQEVLYSQLLDIHSQLGSDWAYIGKGRNDGDKAGEFSPVFYRQDTWRCERNKTYWLSTTPEKPSKGWDAALNRIVTMGLFSHRETGFKVLVMATHFDHRGETSRVESAKLILQLSSAWQHQAAEADPSGGEAAEALVPVLLGGDFNSSPEGGGYRTITAPDTGMKDVYQLIPEARRYGNRELTYTSFDQAEETPARIDFLFTKDTSNAKFLNYGILSNRFDDGVFLSDHRACVADMEIPVQYGHMS